MAHNHKITGSIPVPATIYLFIIKTLRYGNTKSIYPNRGLGLLAYGAKKIYDRNKKEI